MALGHRTYTKGGAANGDIAGKYLKGWFYLIGNYPERYYSYDDPEMQKYYAEGIYNCPNSC